MKLKLTKPVAFFDLETTGLSVSKDRIVEIGIIKVNPDQSEETLTMKLNPEMKISQESIDIHARQGFPENGVFGICFGNLILAEVAPSSWADLYTNIGAFIGWQMVKLNGQEIKTDQDFCDVKATLEPGQEIVFSLKKASIFSFINIAHITL